MRNRMVIFAMLLVALAVIGIAIWLGMGSRQAQGSTATARLPESPGANPGQPILAKGAAKGKQTNGMAALKQATDANRYLFILFFQSDDGTTQAMRDVITATMEKVQGKADWVAVNVGNSSEKEIVNLYEVDRSPMPLALVVAPNGAVTGGFPTECTEENLLGAFVSPGQANCLKAMQDGRYVLLCIQNKNTSSNDAAMAGVTAFKKDKRYAKTTEVIKLDPQDGAEADFLKQLTVDNKTKVAVTVFIAPLGTILGSFEGATTQDMLVTALEAESSSGCGCGPGGCS